MAQATPSGTTFRFDEFELDVHAGELRRSGTPVKLQLQPFKVLSLLVTRAGQVIQREEIRRHLWGEETFVDYEQGMNYCIRQIRAALTDDADRPRYIETAPRRGYRFIAPVVELMVPARAASERVMLAVLPLENLDGDPGQEYLADGLTEEIITELAHTCPRRLGVIARTSAMQYKRTSKGIRQIGAELGVDYVVEGAVRRDANRVRITAQLIRVSDQTHVWAEGYDADLAEILRLQRKLAAAIAAEIQVMLVPGEEPVPARPRVDAEAYDAYLKGRYLWNRRTTQDDLYRALECFVQAIEKDPDYPPAYAGVADTYLVLLDHHYVRPIEALALATAAARNALRLDDKLPEAHTSMGHAKLHALEWADAERSFRTALQLSPGYLPAHFYYASLLGALSRFDESIAHARQALSLDPVSMVAGSNLGIQLYHARRYDEAADLCRKVVDLHPNHPRPHEDLGRILLAKGAFADAIVALTHAVSLSHRAARYLGSLGHALAVSGARDRAREILVELGDMARHRYVASFDFALIHGGLGERDQAIHWLERAYAERDPHLPLLRVDPRLAGLHSYPRFTALERQAGLASDGCTSDPTPER